MSGTSARLLSLLSLLQVRRDWPGSTLAERLAVSHRTVRRDIDRLRELGYPVVATMGPEGGYRLEAGEDMPPLLFDDEQAVALAVALQVVAVSGAGVEESAARALATVRQVLPVRLRRQVDAVQFTVAGSAPSADPKVLASLTTAVRNHELLRFDYGDATRRAEPHQVVYRRARWYLLAWDLDRDDWRTFRVDRIRLRKTVGHRFTPRDVGDVEAFVEGRFKGLAGAGEWPCCGEVVLKTAASKVAPFVGDGTVQALSARRCRVTMGSWSWDGLAASLLRFEAPIEVVGPDELRAAFATLAKRCVDAS